MLKGVGIRIKDLREEHELTMDMLVQDINSRYELENPLNKGMVSRIIKVCNAWNVSSFVNGRKVLSLSVASGNEPKRIFL